MQFLPTVTLTVMREDEGTDAYGDPVRTRTTVKTGIPAHVYEREVSAADPSSGRVMTTRELRAILAGGSNITQDDIIEDSKGLTYTVSSVREFYNPLADSHTELELRRVA